MQLDESFRTSLMLDQWDRLSLAECEEIAWDLDRLLPCSFRFHKIETCALGDQKHHVAIFEWAGFPEGYYHGFFALIPGSEAILGYDRDHPFVPDQHQKESWENETQKTGMFHDSLDVFLNVAMTPFRRVFIKPFLLEVLATPLTPAPVFCEISDGKGGWNWSGISSKPVSYEKTLQRISREGFRFPTSDEWEYACAAGSRTLFRWGNMTPPLSVADFRLHKASRWDLHLRQNAFGLLIARFPYHWEFCAEHGVMRGGDGGTALHAGVGTFAEWLTLASAFHSSVEREDFYGAYLRRVFSLS